jgi:predicted permease
MMSDMLERLRTLVMRSREERELSDEITFHIEMETRKNIDAGLSAGEARRRAEMSLGGSEQIKDRVRDARGTRLIEDAWRDTRLAVRTLSKRPEFTLVMLLILGLGIGANATTFTIVDALLLRRLPVPAADRLIMVGDGTSPGSMSKGTPRTERQSYPLYRDMRDASTNVVTGLYATGRAVRLDVVIGGSQTGTGDPAVEHPSSRYVSGNFFSVLGVNAFAGRTFTQDDEVRPGAAPFVVISNAYWQKRFAGDRSAVGRSLTINGTPMTVIGITPAGFSGDIVGQPTDMWIPLAMQPLISPNAPLLEDRHASWLMVMGRLAPGVTMEQARAVFATAQSRSLTANAQAEDVGAIAEILRDEPLVVDDGSRGFSYYRSAYARSLLTLMIAVGLVMLIVCANVANLMLVRAVSRTREMTVRMAIGSGRGDLIRQMLIESAVLALSGGAVGLLLAHWGSAALLKLAGGTTPIPIDTHLNATILAFTASLSLGTAVLFGLVPALRATRVDLTSTLRANSRSVTGNAAGGRMPLGKILVVAQIALSMVLLVGTGMLSRSVSRLQNVDLGVDREHLVMIPIDAARSGYEGPALETFL